MPTKSKKKRKAAPRFQHQLDALVIPYALVKIVKCSKKTYWYERFVGCYFLVVTTQDEFGYECVDPNRFNDNFKRIGCFINKNDCETILRGV